MPELMAGAVWCWKMPICCDSAGRWTSDCRSIARTQCGHRPILCIVTVSSEAIGANSQLAARIQSLENLGAARINVERLPLQQVETFLGDVIGFEPALVAAIAPSCMGSPVYISMLVRDWAARGLLEPHTEGLRLDPKVSLDDALSLELDAVARRRIEGALASLDHRDAVEESLALAALAGTEPHWFVVRQAGEEGLDGLLSLGLIRQRGSRLVFEHGRIRGRLVEWRSEERMSESCIESWLRLENSATRQV